MEDSVVFGGGEGVLIVLLERVFNVEVLLKLNVIDVFGEEVVWEGVEKHGGVPTSCRCDEHALLTGR